MANVIKHKRGSGSDPSASDLVVGEVAIRTDVGKLFTKMDNGSVAEIAGGGSDIVINTLSSSSGTGGGSATFNGSAYRFTLSAPPSVSAQQLLVSINGVIQKPVAGTGQPSEGFSVDGTDIILGDAPATGSDFFILTFKSLGVSEPADNSVTSAKIVDGTIVNADISDSAAIAGTKIAPDFGTQAISTTATGSTFGRLTISNVNPFITLTDTNNDSDFSIRGASGNFIIRDDTNGAARLTVDSSGNVGIGTSSPTHMLDVSGSNPILSLNDTDTTNDRFRLTYNGGSTQLQVDPNNVRSGSHLLVAVDGTERMRIDSNGRVGISTSSARASAGVSGMLQVERADGNGAINIVQNQNTAAGSPSLVLAKSRGTSVGANTVVAHNDTLGNIKFAGADGTDLNTPAAQIAGQVDGTPGSNDMPGRLVFSTTADGASSLTERMRIDSSGRVGIGTTSPDTLLHLAGADTAVIRLENSDNSLIADQIIGGLEFEKTDPSGAGAGVVGGLRMYSSDVIGSATYLTLSTSDSSTNNAERMRIDSSGKVGIGTTNPGELLSLKNTSAQVNMSLQAATNGSCAIFFGDTDTVVRSVIKHHNNDDSLAFFSAGSERMRIDSSGRVLIGTTTGAAFSNRQLSVASSSGTTSLELRSATDGDGRIIFTDSTSSSDTGAYKGQIMYDQTNDFMSFNTNGNNERLRIDSSGNVGIGTTNPQRTLHQHISSSSANYHQFTNSTTGSGGGDGGIVGIDANEDLILWNQEGQNVRFGTSNTERMRVQTNGGISFNGDTAAANALDDYEEGYWSPTAVDGQTLHLQDSGNVPCRRYIKIGRQVTCWFDINWDSGNSSPNFSTRFSGLPFSVETGGHQAAAAVCIGFFSGSETDMLVGHISGGLVKFFENGDGMYSYSESAGDRISGFVTYTTT